MNSKFLFLLGLLFTFSLVAEPVTNTVAATNAVYKWAYDIYPLAAGSRESLWQEILAKRVGGKRETRIKSGRIDVETETEVFEVDRQDKWKEGMGQALVYATETGKKPVLALISSAQGPENMQKKSRERFDLVLDICSTNKVRLLILFPDKPEEPHKSKADRGTDKGRSSLVR
jgi:hypothetical protein